MSTPALHTFTSPLRIEYQTECITLREGSCRCVNTHVMMEKLMKNPSSKTMIDFIYQGMLSDQSSQKVEWPFIRTWSNFNQFQSLALNKLEDSSFCDIHDRPAIG